MERMALPVTDNNRPIRKLMFRFCKTALTVLLAAMLLGMPAMAESAETDSLKQEVINLITAHHVSGVQPEDLDTESIESVIESLNDPYTEFMTPDEWRSFLDSLENHYVGIGIRFGWNDRGFFVVEVFEGSPAGEAGMREGDYIVAVDGEETAGLSSDELVARITGPAGTNVTVTVEREGGKIDLTMERRDIHYPALTARLIEPGIGYVRLNGFTSDADELFEAETDRLLKEGMRALVLDLRNNPGGLLETAANMASRFVKDGVLIYTRNRTGLEEPYPIGSDHPLDVPVILLVNEYSASASEVLAGALQDYGIARLVGQKTYGKGSVQWTFQLSDGSVLKLTVQEYLTPLKRPVNHVGLEPDVPVYGDAPQLITALQLAGDLNVKIELGAERMTVNGVPVLDRFPVIRDNGKVFVPSRVLAAVVEGSAEWDAASRAVVIRSPRAEAAYPVDSEGVLLKDGVSFIELNRFQARFSPFAWADRDGIVTLVEDGGE